MSPLFKERDSALADALSNATIRLIGMQSKKPPVEGTLIQYPATFYYGITGISAVWLPTICDLLARNEK